MISTGHTLLETAKILLSRGATSVNCLVTHALSSHEVIAMLLQAGIGSVWSTDAILHDSNCIFLDKLLASGVRQLKNE
jgi:ribose-phosphate pyrophosphokinase